MSTTKAKEDHPSSAALTAVAFQDHLVRNLNLSLSSIVTPVKKRTGGCDAKYKKNIRTAKAVVDSGRRCSKARDPTQTVESEYVLDPEPEPLTLAQKFGLVDAPAKPLSDSDWTDLKTKSNTRDDSSLPCVICKDTFGLQPQNCLGAFERFTGRKTCPMCRRREYQTRVIYEGAKICRLKSTIRIQAAWRGYVVRRWYKRLRETVPPKEPLLRKRYYEEKLAAITERMVNSCSAGVNDFLLEIEQSVEASREVFRSLDSSKLRMVPENEWKHIYEKVKARDDRDCPICIMPLAMDSQTPEVKAPTYQEEAQRKGGCVLLSCTHFFHRTCLEAFEELSLLEEKMCPVCRSSYQKHYL